MSANTSKQSSPPPLAVVGLSALFPKAANLDEFWSNIRRGVNAITEVPATHWSPDEYFDANQKTPDMTYARRGGFLSPLPFDPLEFGISPNNLEAIDTSQLLGLVGAKRALEHAGYGAGRQFDRSRVGCILGVTGTLEMVIPLGARLGHPRWRKALKDAGVPDEVAEDVVNRISQSYVPWQENSFPGLLGNVVAGRIANRLDLHGTNCVVDAACASSLSAIHLAALELWTGRSDMVVTGGIDTFNDIFMFMCFSKTPALSPTGDAKPFSDEADGTILGEGVGIVVLKRLADAERDNDRIYAVIKGIGTSSDGAGNAVYAPKAEGQVRCLEDAYRTAGVSPATIELVEAHGTGTKVGDATEVSALMQVYKGAGRRGAWCAIGSVKSQIGHTKAAAGAAGVIKAILALQHQVLPPTVKVNRPPAAFLAEDCPFYVNTEARPWLKPKGYPRRAAVSAFGFGGSNFHCVLEESPQTFNEPEWDGDAQVITLSGSSPEELANQLRSNLLTKATTEWPSVRTYAASSRKSYDVNQDCRLALVVERDKTDLNKLATSAMTMLERYPAKTAWTTPDGAYFGRGKAGGKLGVLFPGQGAQYVGMLRELMCRFPVMQSILADANEVFSSSGAEYGATKRLSDYIYPHPVFSTEDRDRQELQLRATQIAQPAIGAVSLGVLTVLDRFGVRPEAVAGHSYGELTALCASSRFSPQSLYRLSALRGRLMAAAQENDGGMLAVLAPLSQIETALKELSLDLVVANHNSPTQVVLSGRIPDIDRAASVFAKRNIRGKKLPVAAAFHSPLVAPASGEFRPVLDEIDFQPSTMPVYANSTATEYPNDPAAARDLLANQLAQPVQFVREIEQMYGDGVRTFLEVGPSGILTGLVNSILDGKEFRAIATDSSGGKRSGLIDLAHSLANLSSAGYAISWKLWDPDASDSAETSSRRLQIPISGANYVKPREPIPPRAPQAWPTATDSPTIQSDSRSDRDEIANSGVSSMVDSHRPNSENESTNPSKTNRTSMSPAVAPAIGDASVAETLQAIRETLRALQEMQQETSKLHQHFLDGQASALQALSKIAGQKLSGAELSQPDTLPLPNVRAEIPTFVEKESPVHLEPPARFAPETIQPTAVELPAIDWQTNPLTGEPLNSVIEPIADQYPATPTFTTASIEPPAPPARPVPAASTTSAAHSPLAATVLAVVSEKTGYPAEMLNLEMSLDHDLGIDSIKRVEILSALQERVPELPAFQPEELGALHTLNDVVSLADARTSGGYRLNNAFAPTSLAPAQVSAPAPVLTPIAPLAAAIPAVPASNSQQSSLSGTVLEVVAEKTGYPIEMLNLEMSLDHDLGIDSIKRVEILSALQERVPQLPAFQPEELGSLHTLNDVVSLADARTSGGYQPNNSPAQASVAPARATAPVTGPIAPPAAAIQAAAASTSQQSSLSGTVLEVVAEKTGYPIEMLNLEMSLDHDLGIDSIKRVEILSALQERVPELPAFQPEELGSLHTLNDVVALADARTSRKASPTPAAPTAAKPEAPRSPAPIPATAPAPPAFQQPVAAAPSVPKQTSATAADLNRSVIRSVPISSAASRPSIPLFPGSEVWVTEDGLGLSLLVANHLTDQGFKPRIIDLDEPPVGAIPEGLAGLILIAPERGMDQQQLWQSIEWLQKVGPTLRKVGQASAAVVVTVSRIDGFFGFESKKRLRDTVSGGLAGLAKCIHLEWPEVTARAIDLGPQWSAPHVAAAMLVTEMLHEGPVEVGLTPSGPTTLEVVEDELTGQFETPPVRAGEVVVVTGGARGVTAEAAVAMAHAWQPHLVILGRSPELAREPEWLTHLQTEAEIKKALITQMPAGTAPRAVAAECKEILAGREIGRNLQRMRDAGSSVTYRCVDVRNANAVRPVLEEVRRDIGEIRGLIHGAGVLADQRIEDKTKDQFERVYDTKVGGFETLLNCIDSNALRMLGIFSSYTARYGRVGQVDYAIANEVLNKQARLFANLHPNCRVASFNWGPWDGGMVSNDGLKKLFASEGVGLIPTDAGADSVVRELCQTTNRPVEVLLLAKTEENSPAPSTRPNPSPAVMQPPMAASQMGSAASFSPPAAMSAPAPNPANMFAVSRSAKAVVAAANQLLTNSPQSSAREVSINQITHTPPLDTDNLRVAFERKLNIEENPVLQSHVIGGKAVLPVAVMLEWLAHGAIHGNPGLELRGVDDFRVYQGVRLGARDSIQLQVLAGKLHRDDLYYKVPMRIVSRTNGRDVVHAAATVVLAPGYPSTPAPTLHIPMLRPYSMDVDTAYSTRLFHGSKLHGITSIEGCSPEGIVVTSKLAPVSSLWMANPVRTKWLADPLVIDAALQAVILWSQEIRNKPCLPCAITKYRQFRRALPRDGVKIIIRVLPATEQTIRCEIEFVDMLGLLIARMEGCESIADATLVSAFQKNRIDV